MFWNIKGSGGGVGRGWAESGGVGKYWKSNSIRLESFSGDVALGKFFYLSVFICQMGRRISAEAVEKGSWIKHVNTG